MQSTTHSTGCKKLVLIELNELNFDLAKSYIKPLGLKHIRALLDGPVVRTSSETQIHQLEPWIQWVSAHSGKTAAEHGVYRLGDIVGARIPQMFEQLEARGVSVGCVSAMNAENRLKQPAYFVPDPWTATPTDGSFWSKALGGAIAQAVNDNAKGRISVRSAAALVMGLFRFARVKHYPLYARLALNSIGAPWRKALFLDLFLHDFHWALLESRKPGFSTLFLNAGAHIQHHYMFNSRIATNDVQRNPAWYVPPDVDPLAEMLTVYDSILGDYLSLERSCDVLVATGLSQQLYPKANYYYRLTDHAAFLRQVGIAFKTVLPRMTRDFLIEFDSVEDTVFAERRLASFRSAKDGSPMFGDIENRGTSLFLSLVYPSEIDADFVADYEAGQVQMARRVVFVSLNNGMHHASGYAFCRGGTARHAPPEGAHVKHLYGTVMNYFLAGMPEAR